MDNCQKKEALYVVKTTNSLNLIPVIFSTSAEKTCHQSVSHFLYLSSSLRSTCVTSPPQERESTSLPALISPVSLNPSTYHPTAAVILSSPRSALSDPSGSIPLSQKAANSREQTCRRTETQIASGFSNSAFFSNSISSNLHLFLAHVLASSLQLSILLPFCPIKSLVLRIFRVCSLIGSQLLRLIISLSPTLCLSATFIFPLLSH